MADIIRPLKWKSKYVKHQKELQRKGILLGMSRNTEKIIESERVKDNSNTNSFSQTKNKRGWQRVKATIFPWMKYKMHLAVHLAEKYFAAKVEKKEAEADLLRQKATKEFNDNVDATLPPDSPEAKILKLTKLLLSNPEVLKQLKNTKSANIMENLRSTGQHNIQAVDSSDQYAPESKLLSKS